ncbi:MAG: leucine--tRNA ligase, partial [Oligoflexia bacterium]|nr:leucine--tRNA ligase [Oligoflexia bacterium]
IEQLVESYKKNKDNEKDKNKDEFYCDISKKNNKKYYSLAMFPYPSGNAHMGHARVYSISDVKTRFKKLQGHEVLHPIGWDAFGLPAENAAIKNNVRPDVWTNENIYKMKFEQLNKLGAAFDWDKELNTCGPEYYKWTQWLFLELYKIGKAYRKADYVNWCNVDQTVLANEQVIDGKCWRDGSVVEKKLMEQWSFRVTDYAGKLWDDLQKLNNWAPEAIAVQRNWINQSTGTFIDFQLKNFNVDTKVSVFTTRADTLFGVVAIVLAPEHPLVQEIVKKYDDHEITNYVNESLKKSQVERLQNKQKTGIKTKATCLHPFSDICSRSEVELWVGDYVIADYGTGAVMCVPAHDTRDFEFAKKYNLDIIEVVASNDYHHDHNNNQASTVAELAEAYTEYGKLINSAHFNKMASKDAIIAITKELEQKKKGSSAITYQLKDWSVGRQRFWGCPIPIIHCPDCGIVAVSDNDLPVKLPSTENLKELKGKLSLADFPEFVNTKCPKCFKDAKRETDTLDTFLCSSWYAFRFIDNKNDKLIFESDKINHWMPIDFYVGGLEHAAQHMIYFRFITKFLYERGYINFDEPVDRFFCNGMVKKEGFKMSKSRGNVVVPTEAIDKFGTDALRLYILSDTPAELDIDWDDQGIKAKMEFIRKNFNTISTYLEEKREVVACKSNLVNFSQQDFLYDFYGSLNDLTYTVEHNIFHNTVAKMHEMSNVLLKVINAKDALSESDHKILKAIIHDFIIATGILIPYTNEVLLKECFDKNESIYNNKWPVIPTEYVSKKTIEFVVQINGKKRATFIVNKGSLESEIVKIAMNNNDVIKFLDGKQILKQIFVKDKLLNIVIAK